MGRGRLILILVLLVVVIAAVFLVVLPALNPPAPAVTTDASGTQVTVVARNNDDDSTAVPTATPFEKIQVVIAQQDLPRGIRIPPNAIGYAEIPLALAPFNVITDVEAVVGQIARTDIFREQPILSNLLVEDLTGIGRVGSDAAAILPSNLVAVAIPMDRLSSVAYAVQDGDYVDLILSMLFVDLDESFQSQLPNDITFVGINEENELTLTDAQEGRAETLPYAPVVIGPFESQRPRLVTQRTIQGAFVVHVGNFPPDGRFIGLPPTPTPIPTAAADAAAEAEADAADSDTTPPPATPTLARPDVVTLGVSPQEAVVLVWAVEARLPVTMALRSATDTSRVPTSSVTLDYMLNEYNISIPARRPYGIEPSLHSVRQIVAEGTVLTQEETPTPTGNTANTGN